MYTSNYVFFFCRRNVLQALRTVRHYVSWLTESLLYRWQNVLLKAGHRSCGSGTVRGNRQLQAWSAALGSSRHSNENTNWQPRPNFPFANEIRLSVRLHLPAPRPNNLGSTPWKERFVLSKESSKVLGVNLTAYTERTVGTFLGDKVACEWSSTLTRNTTLICNLHLTIHPYSVMCN